MLENSQIVVLENFLDTEFTETYYKFLRTTNLWESNGDGVWNNRSINIKTMPLSIRESVLDYRIRVKNKILDAFSLNKNLYCDIFQFVVWRVGDSLHPPHADAEYPNDVVHPFHYRSYSAVTYLNDNYKGGEIYFTEFDNFKPKISPGTLVIFPTSLKYMHGVTSITDESRYTLAGFYTFDKLRHDGHRI